MAAKWDIREFDLANGTPIGAGAISHVLRVRHTETKALVAVKVLSKIQLIQQAKVEAVLLEKDALYDLGPHPYIVRLLGTAQSEDELYFIMENLPHGDLLQHIRRVSSLRKAMARDLPQLPSPPREGDADAPPPAGAEAVPFSPCCLDFHDIQWIMAQLILALKHVFEKGYVIRDLKPENICFDSEYRCCLIDFDTVWKGFAVPHTNHGQPVKDSVSSTTSRTDEHGNRRRLTVSDIQGMRKAVAQFCGTAQYVSPEMVGELCWSYSSDLWALGVICYQCLYGRPPFRGASTFAVMRKLVAGLRPEKHFRVAVELGSSSGSGCPLSNFDKVKSFVSQLLRVDPTMRLGVNPITLAFDMSAFKLHPMFDGFDWEPLEAQVQQYHFPGPIEYLRRIGATQEAEAVSDAVTSSSRDAAPSSVISTPPQRGFAAQMHCVPHHDDEYASYVFRAGGGGVNPFEQWGSSGDSPPRGEEERPERPKERDLMYESSDDDEWKPPTRKPNSDGSDSSSSTDDVVDDVGVQGMGNVDRDFR